MVFKIHHSWRKINMLNKWSFLFQPSNSKFLNALFLIPVSILSMEMQYLKYIIWAIVVCVGNVLQYRSRQKLLHLYYQVLICTVSAVFPSNMNSLIFLMNFTSVSVALSSYLTFHCDTACCWYFLKVLDWMLVYFITRLWHLSNHNTQIHTYNYSVLLDLFQCLP